MRAGLLGGTFDPPHNGHLAIAAVARERCRLERVLLIPAPRPPHKPGGAVAAPADRLAMCRLAVAGIDWLEVSEVEMRRPGPSYSLDTVRELRLARGIDEPVWVAGTDSLLHIESWHRYREFLAECELAAAERPGVAAGAVAAVLRRLGPLAGRVILLHEAGRDVSATEVRRRAAAALPVEDLVPPPVARYIRERGLYRRPATA